MIWGVLIVLLAGYIVWLHLRLVKLERRCKNILIHVLKGGVLGDLFQHTPPPDDEVDYT